MCIFKSPLWSSGPLSLDWKLPATHPVSVGGASVLDGGGLLPWLLLPGPKLSFGLRVGGGGGGVGLDVGGGVGLKQNYVFVGISKTMLATSRPRFCLFYLLLKSFNKNSFSHPPTLIQ